MPALAWRFALIVFAEIVAVLIGWAYDVWAYDASGPTVTGWMRSHPIVSALAVGGLFGLNGGLAFGHLFGRGMPLTFALCCAAAATGGAVGLWLGRGIAY